MVDQVLTVRHFGLGHIGFENLLKLVAVLLLHEDLVAVATHQLHVLELRNSGAIREVLAVEGAIVRIDALVFFADGGVLLGRWVEGSLLADEVGVLGGCGTAMRLVAGRSAGGLRRRCRRLFHGGYHNTN